MTDDRQREVDDVVVVREVGFLRLLSEDPGHKHSAHVLPQRGRLSRVRIILSEEIGRSFRQRFPRHRNGVPIQKSLQDSETGEEPGPVQQSSHSMGEIYNSSRLFSPHPP